MNGSCALVPGHLGLILPDLGSGFKAGSCLLCLLLASFIGCGSVRMQMCLQELCFYVFITFKTT